MQFKEWLKKYKKDHPMFMAVKDVDDIMKDAFDAGKDSAHKSQWDTEDGEFWFIGDKDDGCGVNKEGKMWWGTVVINGGKPISDKFQTRLEAIEYCESLWEELNTKTTDGFDDIPF